LIASIVSCPCLKMFCLQNIRWQLAWVRFKSSNMKF